MPEKKKSGTVDSTGSFTSIRHYFFEFVMLFLAITLGFFVENQRDKIAEQNEEVKLLKSFWADVKYDITRLEEIIKLRSDRIRKNDSLIMMLNSPDRHLYTKAIYEYTLSASSRGTLFYKSNTMQFLSNEGFYKIDKQNVADQIRVYNILTEDLLSSQEGSFLISSELSPLTKQVLDSKVPRQFGSSVENLKLYSTDPDLINQLCNAIRHISGNFQSQVRYAEKMKAQANALYKLIPEEYDLGE